VTHPEARRFFMTVSEAVSLTLQAAARSTSAEIFVLDMGEPIRIVDLAENMIRLAGKVPYEDIEIQFTGLRPGEKLIEELNGHNEEIRPTTEEKMRVIHDEPESWETVCAWIDELQQRILARNEAAIVAHLRMLVPEYDPGGALANTLRAFEPVNGDSAAAASRAAQNGNGACRRRTAETQPIVAFEN
jgi:FlaA1/EpsC-like NDP-sugar epimerase